MSELVAKMRTGGWTIMIFKSLTEKIEKRVLELISRLDFEPQKHIKLQRQWFHQTDCALDRFCFLSFSWMKLTVWSLTAASVAVQRPGWIKLQNPCAPSRIGHTPAHLSPGRRPAAPPAAVRSLWVGRCLCGRLWEWNTELRDGSQVQKAAERLRTTQRARAQSWGSLLLWAQWKPSRGSCLDNLSEEPHTCFFSPSLSSGWRKVGDKKLHSDTVTLLIYPACLCLWAPTAPFFYENIQKSLSRHPDRYDYYKDAVHAAVLNMGLKSFKVNLGNIFKSWNSVLLLR